MRVDALSNRASTLPLTYADLVAPSVPIELPTNRGDVVGTVRAGIDTLSVAWHVSNARNLTWAVTEATVGDEGAPQLRSIPRGVITKHPLHGMHIGAFYDRGGNTGTIFVEGRAAHLFAPGSSLLASRAAFKELETRARAVLGQVGVDIPTLNEGQDVPAVLRRLDIACDVLLPAHAGEELLWGLMQTPSSCDKRAFFARGSTNHLTGIALTLASSGIHFRAYCKATESGGGEYGTHVRMERQIRWERAKRPVVVDHEVSLPDLAAVWPDRFTQWSGMDDHDLTSALRSHIATGTLTGKGARALMGALALGEPLTPAMRKALDIATDGLGYRRAPRIVEVALREGQAALGR